MRTQFARVALLVLAVAFGYATTNRAAAVSPGNANAYTYRLGFDTQTAPTVAEMQYSWSNYAYSYVGIYISGNNRAAQPQLTPASPTGFNWVSSVNDIGFGFIPIDVGWQAPNGCGLASQPPLNRMSPDPTTAYNQGVQQAVTAAQAARDLGFTGPSPVYVDMEAYTTGNSVCHTAVVEFLHGWLTQMKQFEGKVAGAYGSSSGSDVQSWAAISPPPDDIWFAEWNALDEQDPNISVWATGYISSSSWRLQPPYGRLHQFKGDIPNIFFGDTWLQIDQTCAWGIVAGKGYVSDTRFPNCPGTPPP
jgi:hypothetical protein